MALRPKQWLKNVLVVAAPGAAGVLFHGTCSGAVVLTFVAFCCMASALYLRNDLADLASDRTHPSKRLRPIAAGTVSLSLAGRTSWVLGAMGLALSVLTFRWEVTVALLIYAAITTAYTHGLKQVAVLDLVAVTSGFVVCGLCGCFSGRRARLGLVHHLHIVRVAVRRGGQAVLRASAAGRGCR